MFFGLEHFIPYFPSKVVYQQLFVVCWWCSRVHRPLFRRPCMAWMELSKLKSWVVANGNPHIWINILIPQKCWCWCWCSLSGSPHTHRYGRGLLADEWFWLHRFRLCSRHGDGRVPVRPGGCFRWNFCGFCPVHHFPSIFRSCFGMKVGEYLQNVTWSLSSNMGSRAESHEVA